MGQQKSDFNFTNAVGNYSASFVHHSHSNLSFFENRLCSLCVSGLSSSGLVPRPLQKWIDPESEQLHQRWLAKEEANKRSLADEGVGLSTASERDLMAPSRILETGYLVNSDEQARLRRCREEEEQRLEQQMNARNNIVIDDYKQTSSSSASASSSHAAQTSASSALAVSLAAADHLSASELVAAAKHHTLPQKKNLAKPKLTSALVSRVMSYLSFADLFHVSRVNRLYYSSSQQEASVCAQAPYHVWNMKPASKHESTILVQIAAHAILCHVRVLYLGYMEGEIPPVPLQRAASAKHQPSEEEQQEHEIYILPAASNTGSHASSDPSTRDVDSLELSSIPAVGTGSVKLHVDKDDQHEEQGKETSAEPEDEALLSGVASISPAPVVVAESVEIPLTPIRMQPFVSSADLLYLSCFSNLQHLKLCYQVFTSDNAPWGFFTHSQMQEAFKPLAANLQSLTLLPAAASSNHSPSPAAVTAVTSSSSSSSSSTPLSQSANYANLAMIEVWLSGIELLEALQTLKWQFVNSIDEVKSAQLKREDSASSSSTSSSTPPTSSSSIDFNRLVSCRSLNSVQFVWPNEVAAGSESSLITNLPASVQIQFSSLSSHSS